MSNLKRENWDGSELRGRLIYKKKNESVTAKLQPVWP